MGNQSLAGIRTVIGGLVLLSCPLMAVTNQEVSAIASKISKSIGDISNVRVVTLGNTILIEGQVEREDQMDRLARLAEATKDLSVPNGKILVRNMATISQGARDALAGKIRKFIGGEWLQVRFINDSLFLEGTADNDYDADRAIGIAKGFFRTSDSGWAGDRINREVGQVGSEEKKSYGERTAGSAISPIWGQVTIVDMMRIRPPARLPGAP